MGGLPPIFFNYFYFLSLKLHTDMPKKDVFYNIDDEIMNLSSNEDEEDYDQEQPGQTADQTSQENDPDELDSFISQFSNQQELFSGIAVPVDANLSEEQESFIDSKQQSGFQCPIKGQWNNLGDFSPGVATDARHPTGHQGVDLQAARGTAIYPLAPGVVTKAATTPKSGNSISITHDNEIKSFYAHCDTVKVKPGDKVDYNTVIGTVGDSGNAKGTSPHLHFQVWKNNQLKNPAEFFTVPKYAPAKSKSAHLSKIDKLYKLASYYYDLTSRFTISN